MGTIKTHTIPEALVFTPIGTITRAEVVECLSAHYPSAGERNKLWDMRQADLSGLTETDLAAIAQATSDFISTQSELRTAYLVTDAEAYLNMARYLVQASVARVHTEYKVFQVFEDARAWLARKEKPRR